MIWLQFNLQNDLNLILAGNCVPQFVLGCLKAFEVQRAYWVAETQACGVLECQATLLEIQDVIDSCCRDLNYH